MTRRTLLHRKCAATRYRRVRPSLRWVDAPPALAADAAADRNQKTPHLLRRRRDALLSAVRDRWSLSRGSNTLASYFVQNKLWLSKRRQRHKKARIAPPSTVVSDSIAILSIRRH